MTGMTEQQRHPQRGDTCSNGWVVDYVAEGVVWFVGEDNPIPLEHIARTDKPNTWKLVGIPSVEDQELSRSLRGGYTKNALMHDPPRPDSRSSGSGGNGPRKKKRRTNQKRR